VIWLGIGSERGSEMGLEIESEIGSGIGLVLGLRIGSRLGSRIGSRLGSRIGLGRGSELDREKGLGLGLELEIGDIMDAAVVGVTGTVDDDDVSFNGSDDGSVRIKTPSFMAVWGRGLLGLGLGLGLELELGLRLGLGLGLGLELGLLGAISPSPKELRSSLYMTLTLSLLVRRWNRSLG
jgi:hypothetical protein